ncbi:MAG: hypothetical protein RLY58_2371 [Pseudomonadota bacterium]|jgi:uncharacterized membrane protein YoaT (DUF817 family)
MLMLWDLVRRGSSAALFGILLLLAFVVTAQGQWPMCGLYRYDFLLCYAVLIQIFLIYFKLESWREVAVIAVFHVLAMLMELFLTSPRIGSWHYPEAGVLRINNVPLFAGFMYSAVGSFLARSLRLFSVSFDHLPPFFALWGLALLSYVNFFSHHFYPDLRLILFAVSLTLFWHTRIHLRLGHTQQKIDFLPLLLGLAGMVWVAENIATFSNIWLYPSQVNHWHWVGVGKVGSWYLLLLLSLVLVWTMMGTRTPTGWWVLRR